MHQTIWPSGNFLARNAPFGTLDTPATTIKIIGSKYVPVLETKDKNSHFKGYRSSRRLLALDPISDKPTQINPTLLQANTNEDSQGNSSPNLMRKTPLGFRPDSKTMKLSPYSTLPPIARYRTKNQMSTVFEPECWTLPRKDFMNGREHSSGYLGKTEDPNYLTRQQHLQQQQRSVAPGVTAESQRQQQLSLDIQHDVFTDSNTQTDHPQQNLVTVNNNAMTTPAASVNNSASTTEDGAALHVLHAAHADHISDRQYLLGLLPKLPYLPSEPLRLNADTEIKLMKMLHDELATVHPNVLREIYMMLCTFDRRLTGWCRLQDISFTLSKMKVTISTDTLRLAASLFVAKDYPGLVNYEKILSLFGAALKFGHNSNVVRNHIEKNSILSQLQQPEDSPPKYFNNNLEKPGDLPKGESPLPDQDIAKLIRAVERELRQVNYNINFDKLTSSFQTEDRNHRETLSADQIKRVCYRNSIPVSESLLDDILYRCCDVSNGQYSWHKFISFLERVQPIHTGLRIPSSKRPLEYAKNYLAPLPNWPKATQSPRDVTQKVLPTREQSLLAAGLPSNKRMDGNRERNTPQHQKDEDKSRLKDGEQMARGLSPNYGDRCTDPMGTLKAQTGIIADDGSWFDRFMKLANRLYAQDSDHAGFLPLDDVWSLVHASNSKYNLGLPELKIEHAIAESLDHNQVNLHSMLKQLGGIPS
ncbi:uncharacterized protein LOC115226750 isoform X2 [Octopus sinensis]|uniref:Uncharacterized protein LOC115226750 isoform X2 n=1 Tax=Octopus sinensis TaxID=2607531 RepID=A0A7E6FUQ5_9MOLL|nr:uncharacterized protein LOC115226750 isoform X2 [Octopus sinensis]